MILTIDTSNKEIIKLKLLNKGKTISDLEFESKYSQSEKLLFAIKKLLENNNISLQDLEEIQVSPKGNSFSSLRIGIVIANTLAYALQIPVVEIGNKKTLNKTKKIHIVRPEYNKKPNITVSKQRIG